MSTPVVGERWNSAQQQTRFLKTDQAGQLLLQVNEGRKSGVKYSKRSISQAVCPKEKEQAKADRDMVVSPRAGCDPTLVTMCRPIITPPMYVQIKAIRIYVWRTSHVVWPDKVSWALVLICSCGTGSKFRSAQTLGGMPQVATS